MMLFSVIDSGANIVAFGCLSMGKARKIFSTSKILAKIYTERRLFSVEPTS